MFPINNIPALVQIMARRWTGDKPLSEPMMVSLLTHVCVIRPNTTVTPAKPTRNRPQTDKNHQIRGAIDLLSVLIRFCLFGVGLCLGRHILSVLSGSVRGRVVLNSATDGRWFVGLRSVMYGAYVGRPDTDSRPIQHRIKSDITPNCVETADTFPNRNRRVPDISRTQNECKPITVCGVMPTYKSTQKFRKISLHQSGAMKWHFKTFVTTKPNMNVKVPISIIFIANYILYPPFHFQYWVWDNIATILRTIFWNIISMYTYVTSLKLHWTLLASIQLTICLHLSSLPRWFFNIFFFLIYDNE